MNKPGLMTSIWIALAICWLTGCSGNAKPPQGNDPPDDSGQKPVVVSISPLLNCSASGISHSASADKLIVNFSSLPAGGQFLRISLPTEVSATAYAWAGTAATAETPVVLTLAVPMEDGIELGVVPLQGYTNQQLTFYASLGQANSNVSSVPSGSENELDDLEVIPLGLNSVRLSWTQQNAGDYNFDGRVDLADLRVVAEHYGQSTDRQAAGARSLTAYWVDGSRNGQVDAADINTILDHYGSELIGYNVRRNSQLVPAAAQSGPSVVTAAAQRRAGLPALYSLELSGTTIDAWSVTAVGAEGIEGAGGVTDSYVADLLVRISINGVPLADVIEDVDGDKLPVKWGTRVIDPGEIIGRPTYAKPRTIYGGIGSYIGLPRGKQLLLDIRYLPTVDLATGAPRSASAKQACNLDDISSLQITALPFTLIEGSNMLEINADIQLTQHPESGYYVDLEATTSIPGQPEIVSVSRLSYAAGVLISDSDSNGSYLDEVQFQDDDRDQVSNQRIEFVQDTSSAPSEPQLLALKGALRSFDPASAYITLEDAVVISGEADLPAIDTPLFVTEDTVFAFGLDPNLWALGEHVSLDALVLNDTHTGVAPVYWVQRAELLSGALIHDSWLVASDDQPWQIEISWQAIDSFVDYFIERYEYLPGYGFVVTAEPRLFHFEDAPTYVDYEVVPGVEYRYKLYGVMGTSELVLLGEDVGLATDEGDPGGGRFFAGQIDWISFDQVAISSADQQWIFFYDFLTLWIGEDPGAAGPSNFAIGDPVEVLAYEDRLGWYAFQVAKAQAAPPGI